MPDTNETRLPDLTLLRSREALRKAKKRAKSRVWKEAYIASVLQDVRAVGETLHVRLTGEEGAE